MFPSWDGVPPTPPDSTTEGVLATWWAVCLLHSRRMTFLFHRCLSFCLSAGGYSSLWSQVLLGGGLPPSPVTGPVQSPVPGPAGGGYPSQDRTGPPGTGQGTPQTKQGVPPSQDRGYPFPQDKTGVPTGQDKGYPQTGGIPLERTGGTPPPGVRASDAMPRAVRLLQSRRRTFLFENVSPEFLGDYWSY